MFAVMAATGVAIDSLMAQGWGDRVNIGLIFHAQVLEEYDGQGNPISAYTYGLDLD